MKVYDKLSLNTPYKKDDEVKGRVYEISDNFGVFVAVDDQYSALIPKREAPNGFRVGEVIEGRVVKVHEDGREPPALSRRSSIICASSSI